MLKFKLDADKAREVLEVLDSWVVKDLIVDWMSSEKARLQEASVQEWEKGTSSLRTGTASGVSVCINRVLALRQMCLLLVKKEVENLLSSGGPTNGSKV